MTARARPLAASIIIIALGASGCGVAQTDLNRSVQDQLAVTGRSLGFALDARIQVLELERALLKRDPSFAVALGATESEILGKIERARAEQREIQAQIMRVKAKYPVEDETP